MLIAYSMDDAYRLSASGLPGAMVWEWESPDNRASEASREFDERDNPGSAPAPDKREPPSEARA